MNEVLEPAEVSALTSHREAMYRLLSRLYEREMDAGLLEQLRRVDLSAEEGSPELLAGYGLLKGYLDAAGETALLDLAAQFARIFLGAGPREGDGAFPYESVYRSPDHLLMQAPRQEAATLYRASGVNRAAGFHHPEDHVALELAFMAHLCQEAARANEAGDAEGLRASLTKQGSFLDEHLASWVPALCTDVERLATSGFYKGVARVTAGYLAMDRELIRGLLDGE